MTPNRTSTPTTSTTQRRTCRASSTASNTAKRSSSAAQARPSPRSSHSTHAPNAPAEVHSPGDSASPTTRTPHPSTTRSPATSASPSSEPAPGHACRALVADRTPGSPRRRADRTGALRRPHPRSTDSPARRRRAPPRLTGATTLTRQRRWGRWSARVPGDTGLPRRAAASSTRQSPTPATPVGRRHARAAEMNHCDRSLGAPGRRGSGAARQVGRPGVAGHPDLGRNRRKPAP